MAARKLPPGEKQIHVGVSMPPEAWQAVQMISRARGPRCSASAIVREAVSEYLARRFGPTSLVTTEREAVPA